MRSTLDRLKWLGRLVRLAQTAKRLNDFSDKQNTLYCGLSGNDVRNLERYGAIIPNDPDGNLTPEEHAISSEGSQYVGFTRDRAVAVEFANSGPDPSGYVVTIDAEGANYAGKLVEHDTTGYSAETAAYVKAESEVFIRGSIPISALRTTEKVDED